MADFLAVLSEYDLATAYWVNIQLALIAGLLAFVLGTFVSMMRISPIPSLNFAGAAYVNLLRNTPLTIIISFGALVLWPIFDIKFSKTFTQLLGIEFESTFAIDFFWLGIIGLTIYHAAFFCEAIRSGVNTVPTGQAEAARAIGLPFFAAARHVILPQALRGAIAPIGNVVIALIKNTTVVAAGSVATEISTVMAEMVEVESDYVYAIFLTVAIGFVIIVIPVGLLTTYLSRRLAVQR